MAKIDHRPVEPVVNPETETATYPWMSDGWPVASGGSIEGCSCEMCETRRREAEETEA